MRAVQSTRGQASKCAPAESQSDGAAEGAKRDSEGVFFSTKTFTVHTYRIVMLTSSEKSEAFHIAFCLIFSSYGLIETLKTFHQRCP